MSILRRILFVSLLAIACSAIGANNRATDAAFSALLSMPAAQPENGSWNTPELADFEATTEARLIAYLARQHKAGADFNAYRHHGTLLHHAIRAGLLETAAWLLQHGADPALKVSYGGPDALGLSLDLKHMKLAATLQQKYQMTLPKAAVAATVPAPEKKDEKSALEDAVREHAKSPAELDRILAAMPPATLRKHGRDALHTLGWMSSMHVDDKSGKMVYGLPAASWRVLWRHLPKPLDYDGPRELLSRLQPELWPELMASGYAPQSAEVALGCLLADIDAAQLKSLWPQLNALFPDLRKAAARMVLANYRMRGRHYCYQRHEENVPAKLAFLSSIGINEPVTGMSERELVYASPALKKAVQPFIATAPRPEPRLVDAKPACTFKMTNAWYTALTGKTGWPIDTVQLLEVPGAAQCALLVGGDERWDDTRGAVVDGFNGPEREPVASCADPADVYEVWREVGGKIVASETNLGHDDTASPLMLVQDTVTGKRYYLNDGIQNGKCHARQRLPFAFEWRAGKLMEVSTDELENVLFQQCNTNDGSIQCAGIAALARGYTADEGQQTLYEGTPLQRLLSTISARPAYDPQQQRYMAAVLALDKEVLKTMRANELPGFWTAAAISAVSTATMPLADKRKRIAWLFYDHAQLARAFDDNWPAALLDWLPNEDWAPVLKALPERHLDSLRAAAAAKGKTKLACDIDNARGWICGEALSAER